MANLTFFTFQLFDKTPFVEYSEYSSHPRISNFFHFGSFQELRANIIFVKQSFTFNSLPVLTDSLTEVLTDFVKKVLANFWLKIG